MDLIEVAPVGVDKLMPADPILRALHRFMQGESTSDEREYFGPPCSFTVIAFILKFSIGPQKHALSQNSKVLTT